jgi:hypothetical protein
MMANSIEDLIDPKRPGHLRPQVLLTPSEFMEASRLGLKSASGKDLKLIETSIEPLSAKALRPLAPAELRKAVDDAQRQLEESQAITTEAFKRWRVGMAERSKFDKELGAGAQLTDAGVKRRQQMDKSIEDHPGNPSQRLNPVARISLEEGGESLASLYCPSAFATYLEAEHNCFHMAKKWIDERIASPSRKKAVAL